MAAFRKIATGSSILPATSCLTLIPPAFLVSCRGLVSKLFVGGLSVYTTEQGLTEAFSECGQVIEAKILRDSVTKQSKGFGFVTFASVEEADKAITEMNRKQLNGRVIYVDFAKPKTSFRNGMPIARGPPDPVTNSSPTSIPSSVFVSGESLRKR